LTELDLRNNPLTSIPDVFGRRFNATRINVTRVILDQAQRSLISNDDT